METNVSTEWRTHLREHIDKWPATKEEIVTACNMLEDIPADEKKFVMDNLPEGTYESPDEVQKTLEGKMTEKTQEEMPKM